MICTGQVVAVKTAKDLTLYSPNGGAAHTGITRITLTKEDEMRVWLSRDRASKAQGNSRDYYVSFKRPHNADDTGYAFWVEYTSPTLQIDPKRFHRNFPRRLKPGEGPVQISLEMYKY